MCDYNVRAPSCIETCQVFRLAAESDRTPTAGESRWRAIDAFSARRRQQRANAWSRPGRLPAIAHHANTEMYASPRRGASGGASDGSILRRHRFAIPGACWRQRQVRHSPQSRSQLFWLSVSGTPGCGTDCIAARALQPRLQDGPVAIARAVRELACMVCTLVS